jgi:hypothetical protein
MSKRIVKEIDFTTEGAHIALVAKAANGEKVLLMKKKTELKKAADEVLISTSMQTFLTTFFYMYSEDANELAQILGYDPQEWTYDIIGDETEITLLKSLTNEDKISQDLYEKIEKMETNFKHLEKEGKDMKTNEEKKAELQKSIDDAVAVAVKVAIEKAAADSAVALEAKDTVIADLRKVEDKRIKDEYTELVKGYSFVEDADVLATTLFKCRGIEGFDVILTTMEKARTAMAEALEGEVGTDEEKDLNKSDETPDQLTKTAELIKARYNKETK